MRKRDLETYQMTLTTFAILSKNQDKFSQFAAFKTYLNRLEKDIKQLSKYIQTTERLKKGTHKSKQRLQKKLIPDTYRLSLAMKLLAINQKDDINFVRYRVTKGKFMQMRDTTLSEKSKSLLADILKNKKKLLIYGVTEERIQEYKELVEDFAKAIGEAESKIIKRKLANKDFIKLLRTVKHYLYHEIDTLMEVLEKEDSHLLKAYLKARKIKNIKNRRRTFRSKNIIQLRKIS